MPEEGVTSPTIRKRILKRRGGRQDEGRQQRVTSPTIRKRILKHDVPRGADTTTRGYIAYDPQEDTETSRRIEAGLLERRVTSPTIRKRILKHLFSVSARIGGRTVTSPTIRKRILKPVDASSDRAPPVDAVTSPTIRKRILKQEEERMRQDHLLALHRLRSARGY